MNWTRIEDGTPSGNFVVWVKNDKIEYEEFLKAYMMGNTISAAYAGKTLIYDMNGYNVYGAQYTHITHFMQIESP